MTNEFMDAARELGLENDPTIQQLSRLLYAQDRAFERHVNEQLAVCERVGKQLDKVPQQLVRLVTEDVP